MPIVSANSSFTPQASTLQQAQLLATIVTNGLLGERLTPGHKYADPLIAQDLINKALTDGVVLSVD
jgi:hypothetical protein